ncbi:polyprenyl diphosphate synthase [Muricoccus pecuniae]|uniref:Isoprenyl transferase n=1 Tax=Muricoccus pecuniae TaxID=693023 RepID=A0A840YHT8_9PROT|nr:polyprenyl diphosphate synthase [Roseomonas pecuniae]MBB5693444.1 undecaprenyl diphosphate synthase [Roseomonas pecuniae]
MSAATQPVQKTGGSTPPAPAHVGIIMDGNGRWAAARGVPRALGHKAGAEATRRVVEAAADQGVSWLTLFAFSSENWRRPADEVRDLTGLMRHYLRHEVGQLVEKGVRLRIIGDRAAFGPGMLAEIERAEAATAGNRRINLNVALSYGGRAEIARAARDLARRAAAGEIDPDAIDEAALAAGLETAGMPDPDLIIRTSGEQRISNFLLWQAAYAEFVFQPVLWPDYGADHLRDAIAEFRRRDRRFGARTG